MHVVRKSGYVGMAVPYRIMFEGREIGAVYNGKEVTLQIPARPGTLSFEMLGNSFTLHPIKASLFVNPSQCKEGRIECVLHTRAKLAGMLSSGILGPIGVLELESTVR